MLSASTAVNSGFKSTRTPMKRGRGGGRGGYRGRARGSRQEIRKFRVTEARVRVESGKDTYDNIFSTGTVWPVPSTELLLVGGRL